jgi:DNA-binding NarL/FixJ family response regulator
VTLRANLSPTSVSCLLADDSGPVLEALEAVLEGEGIDVVGVARTGFEMLRLLERLPTTAIVIDRRLPDLTGLEVARRAAEILRRKTAIVVYMSSHDSRLVGPALDAGARAVVVKGESASNLLDALSAVADGQVYVDPQLRADDELRRP